MEMFACDISVIETGVSLDETIVENSNLTAEEEIGNLSVREGNSDWLTNESFSNALTDSKISLPLLRTSSTNVARSPFFLLYLRIAESSSIQ